MNILKFKFGVQHQEKHIMEKKNSYFLKKEKRKSKILKTSLFMLEAKHAKSRTTLASSFIRLSKQVFSFNFKLMDMTKFNVSFHNQGLVN
jgi:hypothetical protein